MNIIMLMSGGVGSRFGSKIPKQYNLLNGKPVIDYVVEAVKKSKRADRVVVVMDPQCARYSKTLRESDFDFVENGKERLDSLKNGFDHIKSHYACDRVVIVDAVGPFVYPELIDDYFDKLSVYDAVITAQKITGALGNYRYDPLDREEYYMTQSPEGFRFELLMQHFRTDVITQELAWQLPREATKYLNFDFKYNLKLTYDYELKYAEYMIDYFRQQQIDKLMVCDKSAFVTEGIKSYLLRMMPEETNQWLDMIYENYSALAKKWGIKHFIANQASRFGLVLLAESEKYGDVILKYIPEFVHRFEKEVLAYQTLSESFMCPLLDVDEKNHALLLKQARPASYASFEDNIALKAFFENVFRDAVRTNTTACPEKYETYRAELVDKQVHAADMPYCRAEIEPLLEKAIRMLDREFDPEENCVLHMDMHCYNVVKDKDHYVAIDPIGSSGPVEMEAVRFIRNDVRGHLEFGMEERFEMLFHWFAKWVPYDKLVMAEYIDMVFITYNSTFENEDDAETRLDLEMIDVLEKKLRSMGCWREEYDI